MGVFEQNKAVEKIGKAIGYVLSYIIFTTLLFLALSYLKKMPSSWNYFYVAGITLAITIMGIIIKRMLR